MICCVLEWAWGEEEGQFCVRVGVLASDKVSHMSSVRWPGMALSCRC